ncbi:MAG: hypothetical protein HC865_18510 [Cyanobacteria bacterium RU_5_0]|nr:hypothetical protein [Cyanobacteria bacterium RU_5_0]
MSPIAHHAEADRLMIYAIDRGRPPCLPSKPGQPRGDYLFLVDFAIDRGRPLCLPSKPGQPRGDCPYTTAIHQ